MDPVITEVLARSALVSVTATVIATVLGVSWGTALALAPIRENRLVITLVNTGMALPTVVVGLVVAMLLWRSGPLGDLDLIYTVPGMIIAQVCIVVPLVTGITMSALRQLPHELVEQLRMLGAGRLQVVLRLWAEAKVALLAAAMAGFGLAISEVGAVTIVGGNVHGHTQVMTTAIVENVSRGEFGVALVYAAVLLALAFTVNAVVASAQRNRSWARG